MMYGNLVAGINYNFEDCSWEFHFNGEVISTNFINRDDCLGFAISWLAERYFLRGGEDGVALLDNGNTTPSHG